MSFIQNEEWGKAPRAIIPKKQEGQLNHQVSRGRRPLLQKAKKDIQSLKPNSYRFSLPPLGRNMDVRGGDPFPGDCISRQGWTQHPVY